MDNLARNNELLEKLIKKSSPMNRFSAGFFQALGATVGLAIFLAISGYLISRVELVPLIGSWLSQIIEETLNNINSSELL